MAKMIAILHDGTFDGDNSFYVSTYVSTTVFEYTNETLEQLIEKLRQKLKDDGDNQESIDEMATSVKGAWIIDEKGIELLDVVTDQDCGGDSAVYRVNHTAKRVAAHIAIKCHGQKAKHNEDEQD